MKRRTAVEKIADLTEADVGEIRDAQYKPGTLARPSVYVVGDDYYAASPNKPRHQVGQDWQRLETWRGDVVWCSKMTEKF